MAKEYDQWTLCGVDFIAVPLKEWQAIHEERDRLGQTTIADDLTIRQLHVDLEEAISALSQLLSTANHHSWAHIDNGPCKCKSCSMDRAERVCSIYTPKST